jgi:hypothetical protein
MEAQYKKSSLKPNPESGQLLNNKPADTSK